MKKRTIGVLALQGAFAKHVHSLQKLGVETRLVKNKEDLQLIDALIIPGGESTTLSTLISSEKMEQQLRKFSQTKSIFGTCAGLILLGNNPKPLPSVLQLGLIDIHVQRNGYGRQINSFSTDISLTFSKKDIKGLFIRAPKITYCGPEVQILAKNKNEPVLVRQGRHLAAAFHPELTENLSIHKYFLSEVVPRTAT